MSRENLHRRAVTVWALSLAGSVLIVPAFVAVFLSFRWSLDAADTRFETHLIGQRRATGFALFGWFLVLLAPDLWLRGLFGVLTIAFLAYVSLCGLYRARESRVFPPLRRLFYLLGDRQRRTALNP